MNQIRQIQRIYSENSFLQKYKEELSKLSQSPIESVSMETYKTVLETRIHVQQEKMAELARTLVRGYGAPRLLWDSSVCKLLYPALYEMDGYKNELFVELNNNLPKWGFELPYTQRNSNLLAELNEKQYALGDGKPGLVQRQKATKIQLNSYISVYNWYNPSNFDMPLPSLRYHMYERMESLSEHMDEVAELLGNLLKVQQDIVDNSVQVYAMIDDLQGNNHLKLRGDKIALLPDGEFAWLDEDDEECFSDESIIRVINEILYFN